MYTHHSLLARIRSLIAGSAMIAGELLARIGYNPLRNMFNPFKKLFHKKRQGEEIVFEPYLPPAEFDEGRLVEIRDETALTMISRASPGIAKLASNGEMYRALIPHAITLNASSNAAAIYASAPSIASTGPLANPGSVANIAIAAVSMVVGQYYLFQINKRLGSIAESASRIASFQDNEYKARLMGLLASVKVVTTFRGEIVPNDEARVQKAVQIDSFEREAVDLLGQANLSLNGISKNLPKRYKEFESLLKVADGYEGYQKALLGCLREISHLRYALSLGKASKEQCFALYSGYLIQSERSRDAIRAWHSECAEKLGIMASEGKRKKDGIGKLVTAVPGAFNKELRYKAIPEEDLTMIAKQISTEKILEDDSASDPFKKDVELIYRDGKVYYVGD